jgi:hypothetical protein
VTVPTGQEAAPAMAAQADALPSPSPGDGLKRHDRRARLLVFLPWLALASFLALRHVMWRDEVRAYSLALTGNTVVDMLKAVHGEGHPALWYLLLRGLHGLLPYPQILPVEAPGRIWG